jgi:hypothetical protein
MYYAPVLKMLQDGQTEAVFQFIMLNGRKFRQNTILFVHDLYGEKGEVIYFLKKIQKVRW